MFRDNIFNLEHSEDFIAIFKMLDEVGWDNFLERLKVSVALQIASATDDQSRANVQSRVLLIDQLRNFSKCLFKVDNAS